MPCNPPLSFGRRPRVRVRDRRPPPNVSGGGRDTRTSGEDTGTPSTPDKHYGQTRAANRKGGLLFISGPLFSSAAQETLAGVDALFL